MKTRNLVGLSVLAFLAITALSLTGCPEPDPGPTVDPLPELTGTVSISPSTGVTTGTELNASYGGTETVAYQWNKGGAAIPGAAGSKYVPSEAGSYTVTASAAGYKSKTSAAVTVTGASLPDLSGDVTISPSNGVTAGTELSAKYSGTETVTYQWNKGGTAIPDAAGDKYTPPEAGSYTVTASSAGYTSKTSAAVNVTNRTPIADDYDIGSLSQTVDGFTGLTVTRKTDKSNGAVTVYYNGSTALPTASGSYTVTFDVAAVTGWNAAQGLSAGTLKVYDGIFTSIADFKTWLDSKSANTAAAPYAVAVNIADFSSDIRNALNANSNKYLSLDLSGSTLTSIWYSAFYACSSLAGIIIPDGVTSILASAFSGCTSLVSVTIPDSVTSIDDYAFDGCTSLVSVTIPGSVTSIGQSTFSRCTSLADITIGNGVTSIGSTAFSGCTGLVSITFPDSVTSIGIYAFQNCTSLAGITIGNGVTSIGNYTFSGCTGLASITIPDSVTSIGGSAFSGCTGLIRVTIGNGVTSIGNYAFYRCTSLYDITIPGSVTSIENSAFSGCTGLIRVTIGNGVTSIGNSAFNGCTYLGIVTIPGSITSIGNSAFSGCSDLTTVIFEGPIASGNIDPDAFYKLGDILAQFYATDSNGTPGRYWRWGIGINPRWRLEE